MQIVDVEIQCTCNAHCLGAPDGFHENSCAIITNNPAEARGIVEQHAMTREQVEELLADWQDVRTEEE